MKDLVRVFSGEKYIKWKQDLQMYLTIKSLGHLLKPAVGTDEEKAKYKVDSQLIVSHIYFCVSATYQSIVRDCETVVEVLEKLQSKKDRQKRKNVTFY